jgi:hypothetical protein
LKFKVPQNIDIQDRILGPLTMVQFIYAVVGFGVSYIIFNAIPKPFSYFLIAPIVIFVILLDFVKINERPFLDFLTSAITFFMSPKQRFWHQGDDSDFNIEIYKVAKQGPTIQHKNITSEEIQKFANRTDSGKTQLIKN